MAKYVLVDCCPVPAKLAPVLKACLADSGATLQSCYRANDARALLHRCGKHSQTELYNGWLRRLPGYNPANPPSRSTHELRSDGVAYRGPVGRRLLWWQCGIDIDDHHVQAFIKAAAKRGFRVTVTYPSSRSEYHHVNFRKAPIARFVELGHGSRGVRVRLMTRWLAYIRRPNGTRYLRKSTGVFDSDVAKALKLFQKDHHQKADGIYGAQTSAQLKASVRYWKTRKDR
jgi:peptidoglycan hydrolase-like protein with peptidoglycan-binding domain